MAAARFELVLCMALVIVVVNSPRHAADAAITDKGQVLGFLMPCLGYLKATAGPPPPLCCQGVQKLNAAAGTPSDRQKACKILKDVATSYTKIINPARAETLPRACSVNIPYKISMQTDCNRIQ